MLRIPRANAFRRNPLTVSGKEAKELLLSRGGDDPEFVGLVVRGDLNLSCVPYGDRRTSQINSLPSGLLVAGDLHLMYSNLRALPEGLYVCGNLSLTGSAIQSLPANLTVGKTLVLDQTPIRSLPAGLKVGGSLHAIGSHLETLPEDMDMEYDSNIELSNSKFSVWPEGMLEVPGTLNLTNTKIQSLPDNMHVGGNLGLTKTKMKSLPAGLSVSGDLHIDGTSIQDLPPDLRVGGKIIR